MTKIIFDTSALHGFKSHSNRGIGRVVGNLVSCLREKLPEMSLINLSDAGRFKNLLKILPKGEVFLRNHFFYPLNIFKNSGKEDFLFIPSQTDVPFLVPRQYFLFVFDLIPFKHPEWYGSNSKPVRYKAARYLESRGIKNAFHIFCCSEVVKEDLQHLFAIPKERLTVCPLGVDEVFFRFERSKENCRAELKISGPTVLYFGGLDPRKRVDEVVGAANTLKEINFVFIVEEQAFEKNFTAPSNCLIVDHCVDELLASYLKSADVVVFPSVEEGFGLPVFEASVLETPVICRPIRPLVDYFGDNLVYIKKDLINTLVDFFNHQDYFLTKVQGARNVAKNFTWDKSAKIITEVVRAKIGGN